MDHLSALELRLSHERVRLAQAKSDNERALRLVWVRQIESEIAAERARQPEPTLSNDELMRELTGRA